MYLNTNILEGLKYNYKNFLNINVFKYEYIEVFQILFYFSFCITM